MERRSGLKERLSRMFRPSTLLRSSCNSTSATSIFSSSTAVTSKRTTTTTATADIALDPFFNIPRRPTANDYLINSFLGDSVDLSLPFLSADDADRPRHRAPPPLPPRLSVGCGAACQANGPEWGERPATVTRKKKKEKRERRVRESGGLYETGAREGRVCPPVSPSTPFIGFHDGKKNINTTKKKKKKLLLSNGYGFSTSSSAETEEDQVGLFSSDKEGADREEETETFFSSDSSEFYQRPSSKNRRKKKKKPRKKALAPESSGFRPVVAVSKEEEEEDGGGGFPVMKRSRDPYADFRSSMVEMIIERQIFGAAELERLLRAYLSLNCPRHHPVILRAFADIWEVLSGH